ncbi:hypothetical protein ACFSTD_15870 [Novosphingobium colocasiae]
MIYKYSIGRKAKGEDVFVNADQAVQDLTDDSGKAAVAEKGRSGRITRRATGRPGRPVGVRLGEWPPGNFAAMGIPDASPFRPDPAAGPRAG